MAIKGKSKGRGTRPVTRGPKPVYQPVKKPLLARREFWLVVASVVATLAVVGIVLGFIAEGNANDEDAVAQRMRRAATDYRDEIEPILTTIGQPRPPSGFDAFGELGSALADLENETKDARADAGAIAGTTADTVASAENALDALEGIDETALIRGKGFSEEFVLYVINSKANLGRAMRLYGESARLTELAAGATGEERSELVGRARAVLDVANEVFSRGYAEYIEVQTIANIFQPTTPALGTPPTGTS